MLVAMNLTFGHVDPTLRAQRRIKNLQRYSGHGNAIGTLVRKSRLQVELLRTSFTSTGIAPRALVGDTCASSAFVVKVP